MDEKMIKGALSTLNSGLDIAVQKGSYKRQDVVVLDRAMNILETFVNDRFKTDNSEPDSKEVEEKPKAKEAKK